MSARVTKYKLIKPQLKSFNAYFGTLWTLLPVLNIIKIHNTSYSTTLSFPSVTIESVLSALYASYMLSFNGIKKYIH